MLAYNKTYLVYLYTIHFMNKCLLYWIREPFIVNIVTAYYIVITLVWWPVDYDKCDAKR